MATRYCMTVDSIDGNFLTLGKNDSDDGNSTRSDQILLYHGYQILITIHDIYKKLWNVAIALAV